MSDADRPQDTSPTDRARHRDGRPGRVATAVLLAAGVAVYVLLYQLILSDAVRRSGQHTEFWVTLAGMAALTLLGAVYGQRRGLPRPLRLLLVVSVLLSPGAWLVALVRQLRPTPPDERA